MTEAVMENTVESTDQETLASTEATEQVTETSDKVEQGPVVEIKDGKTYMDGVRLYTRDESNRIASKATQDAERRILESLNVDSIDQVKAVVDQLQSVDGDTLNVTQLRDAVKKREATVEELRSELDALKTERKLESHLGKLTGAMPDHWNANQKSAMVDLMKARGMFEMEADTFAIKIGSEYVTDQSGEQPDYQVAISTMAETMGYAMSKPGQKTFDADSEGQRSKSQSTTGVDERRLQTDEQYRTAYVAARQQNPTVSRSAITDAMVRKLMPK